MAFRSQKAIGAFVILLFCDVAAAADQVTIPVRHPHLRKGGTGEIRLGNSSVSFREVGKKQKHSREWAYEDIQQLYVAPDALRILTYEDVAWKLGQDREYRFDQLPEGAAQRILERARPHIDPRRIVAALPNAQLNAIWQVKAKLLEGWGGSEGIVLVGEDSIVYRTEERNASRTWRFSQIANVSTSGPFDLTITTFEQDGSRSGGRRDFRFELKTALPEHQYQALWRRLNEPNLQQSSMNTENKENLNE